MQDIIEEIKDVEGLLNDKEAKTLYNLSRSLRGRGVIVEIGSWKGKSTICLAKGLRRDIKIFAVDPHDTTFFIPGKKKELPTWERSDSKEKSKLKSHGFKESSSLIDFRKNIRKAKVEGIIQEIVKTSHEASKQIKDPIELIFIDGDHTYRGVKEDFDNWFPKVIPKGIMSFHDTLWGDARKLMVEKLYKSKNFRNIRFVNSLTYAQKVDKNSYLERLSNRKNLFFSSIYCSVYVLSFKIARHLPENIKKKLKKIFLSIH